MNTSTVLAYAARARKAIVAVVGAVAQVVALGVLHGDALQWATVIIGVATALGVYHAPNDPAPPRAAPTLVLPASADLIPRDGPADLLATPGRVRRRRPLQARRKD